MNKYIKIALALSVFAMALPAATLTPAAGSNIVLGLVTDFSTVSVWDIRGAGLLDVVPPGGSVAVYDAVGGTDMGYSGTLPFGNNLLYLQAGTEFAVLAFDFSNPVFSGNFVSLPAIAGALTPITVPALASILSSSPLLATFEYSGLTPIDNTLSLVTWQLSALEGSAAVPEPASGVLAAVSGVTFLLIRRRLNRQ